MEFGEEQIKKIIMGLPGFSDAKECKTPEDLYATVLRVLGVKEQLSPQETENFIANYAYVVKAVTDDLASINETLLNLKERDSQTPSDEDYAKKKIYYFAKINREARDEVVDFLTTKLLQFVLDKKTFKFSDREDDGLTMLFLSMRYDYSFFKDYYSIDYDYGTKAKFRYLPGVSFVDMQKTVKRYVQLHQSDPAKYAAAIDDIVVKNKAIDYIRDNVAGNYLLDKRTELFETLVDLYHSGKFQTYITLATIQLEGVFSDCCDILNKKIKKNTGTLVEKADRLFEDKRLHLALYPYYAFEVPLLRNEIAHKGMTMDGDLVHRANEVTLDLYTIIYFARNLVTEKYSAILMAYDKVQETDENKEQACFLDLFSSFQLKNQEFLQVLVAPDIYRDEIDFYSKNTPQGAVSLEDKINCISGIIKSEVFWKYIKDSVLPSITEHNPGKPYDVVDYIRQLRNVTIPVLTKDSPEKLMCQAVSKDLKNFDK